MAESAQPQQGPVVVAFAEHIRAFHRSLPPEEQELLEAVFTLAGSAGSNAAEVQGFTAEPIGLLALVEQMQAPTPMGLAGARSKPKG